MAGNVMLSPRKEKAILLLLSGNTILEVSKLVGVSERTLYRWLATPEFQERLEQEKKKLREQAFDKLKAMLNKAVDRLDKLLDAKKPATIQRACQTVIDYNFKLLERDKEKKPQHPYDEYDQGNPESPSQVVSIYERLNRLKIETRKHIDMMNEELDKKEMERSGGDEIKKKEP